MSTRSFQPGDAYGISTTISGASGALANADSTPTATLYRNGAADGAVTLTVANPTTGVYSVSGTIPGTYAVGDRVSVLFDATVGGVATGAFLDHVRLVGYPNTALPNAAAAGAGGLPVLDGSAHLLAYSVAQPVTLPDPAPAGYGVSGTVDANLVSIVGSAPAAQNLHDDELATAPAIPTAAQVAAAVWQLATTGNEPTGSFGALVAGITGGSGGSVTVAGYATNMDPATIVWAASTRSLTDKAGFALSATGLDAIRGFNGWSFPRAIRALIAVVIGKRSGVPASGTGGTITFTESTTGDYGTLTVDTNGNITAIGMTPVA